MKRKEKLFGSFFFNSKKADIQISMSWIFMIIIGTLFLVLAYNIISKYHYIENQKNEVILQNTFREILNDVGRTSGVEESSLQPIGNIFKDSRVEILCENSFPILSFNEKLFSNNQYLKNYPLFMTYIEQEKIDQTYMAVENFKMPFKIITMLALVSKKNLIVFDNNSDISKDFLFKFNKGSYNNLNYISEDFTTLNSNFISNLKDKNYNSVILVSDYGKSPSIDLNKINSRAYFLEFNKINDYYGTLKYILKDGSAHEFKYMDYNKKLALPTMAIFSSPNTFNCSYNLILRKIPPIYSFYIEKTKFIGNLSKTKKVCSDSVDISSQNLFYKTLNESLINTKNFLVSNNFSDLPTLFTELKVVENSQKELEKFSCSYIY